MDGIGPQALAPLLGLPHLIVPCELFSNPFGVIGFCLPSPFRNTGLMNNTVAQTSYYSRVTDKDEKRPFSGSVMGPYGSDIMLLQLAKAAFGHAKWRSQVDAGRLAFPQGYEPK